MVPVLLAGSESPTHNLSIFDPVSPAAESIRSLSVLVLAITGEPREQAHEPAAAPWTAVLHDWVTAVHHKKIGILYGFLSMLLIGGLTGIMPAARR